MTQPTQRLDLSLLPNIYGKRWDSLWPLGNRPSGIISSPMMSIDFNGLGDGQSVVSTAHDPGSVAGKRFDDCLGSTGFTNGFGIQADTAIKMPGKTSSCLQSIATTSDGDPAGGWTGAAYGAFGGILYLPTFIAEGEELWVGFHMFIPEDFSFETNTGYLKYIRFNTAANIGKIDYLITNGGYNGQPPANQVGWNMIREGAGNDKPASETVFVGSRNLVRGQWNWVEMYMLASNDPAISVRRIWVNEQFSCERVGNVNRHVNNSGTITTQVLSVGERILENPLDTVTSIYLCTYWNGGSPQDQAWNIQNITVHNVASEIMLLDEFGNKMMGAQ